MSGTRQPIDLVIAKGNKHLTKAEIEERRAKEVRPINDEIIAPSYLTSKQKKTFYKIANQLEKLNIMGETDVDALARYITSEDLYQNAVRQLRKKEVRDDPILTDQWSKHVERYFKQSRASASDLGLTISSRCKLIVPQAKEEAPKANKFKQFSKEAS